MRAATPLRSVAALAIASLLALTAPACTSSGKKKPERKRTVLITTSDDEVVGQQAAADVRSQLGVLEKSPLVDYVNRVGQRVLRGMPRRAFGFEFNVVDQMEPNAFALPGGYVFISRGLLALANSEDELACVIGHEIIHSAHRHAAQQQALGRAIFPLAMPWVRAGRVAGYSRDMEREADTDGQKLCAAAGYDPRAMSTFLASLDQRERLIVGHARNPTFLDTHPGARERVATNAMQARELRWRRDPALGDTRASHLQQIDGMVLGDRPETGIFDGNRFVHPQLGFEIRFPRDWRFHNSAGAVGAVAPSGDAMVYLEAAAGRDAGDAAELFAARAGELGMRLTQKHRVKLGDVDALRYEFEGRGSAASVTFFPFDGGVWRVVGVGALAGGRAVLGNAIATARSFRALSAEDRERALEVEILQVVRADPGEDTAALKRRTGNLWDPLSTALVNGLLPDVVFEGGERLKIKRKGRAGTL